MSSALHLSGLACPRELDTKTTSRSALGMGHYKLNQGLYGGIYDWTHNYYEISKRCEGNILKYTLALQLPPGPSRETKKFELAGVS